jgi:hypothetical protein
MGTIPKWLADSTVCEWAVCTPFRTVAVIEIHMGTGFGKGGRVMKSHCITHRLDVQEVADSLPLHPRDTPLQVIVTMPNTTKEAAMETLKKYWRDYQVRGPRIASLLKFLKANNHLFTDIAIGEFDTSCVDEIVQFRSYKDTVRAMLCYAMTYSSNITSYDIVLCGVER